jgi:hypothetical protein
MIDVSMCQLSSRSSYGTSIQISIYEASYGTYADKFSGYRADTK